MTPDTPADGAALAQCCMCGKTDLSTAEDGGQECELHDGRWVCSRECWDIAVSIIDRLIPRPAEPAQVARRLFPILKGEGAKIDYQLVADHAEQARKNHYQSVERLAERGGLSWCELYAVLHNRKWEKIDDNDAMIACRALEARYLAALQHKDDTHGPE